MTDQLTSSSLESFGESVPLGTFTGRVTKIEAKESGEGENITHWNMITYEFLDGEAEGLTMGGAIFPKVTRSQKNGKLYSRGLFEAQQTTANWGSPLPEFSLEEFVEKVSERGARMLQKLLGDSYKKAGAPRLKLRVYETNVQAKNEATGKWENAKNDDGTPKMRRNVVVLGRSTASAASSPSSDDSETKPVTFV